nr:MAG TPA: antitoxin [Caudoviricetes sp.]
MSEKKIKSDLDLEKDFMENNVCPKCGSKNWMLGNRDYDLKCGSCGYLLYDINPIKNTCKELNLTYKQLGEAIGYGEGAIKNSASTGNVSEPMAHAIKMYKRILELERDVADREAVKENLKRWLK